MPLRRRRPLSARPLLSRTLRPAGPSPPNHWDFAARSLPVVLLSLRAGRLTEKSKPAFGLCFTRKVPAATERLLKSRPSFIALRHHVIRHAQVKPYLRVIRYLACSVLEEWQRLLIIATFEEGPAESVAYRCICRDHRSRFA